MNNQSEIVFKQYELKLLITIVFLIVLNIGIAHSAIPNIITSDGKSTITQNRGRWSINPGDNFFDLAGEWYVLKSNMELTGSVELPFAWYGATGSVHLIRSFNLPADGGNRSWRLVIDGASLETRVIVNGVNVESRRGKNLSFQINLGTRILKFGGVNQITLVLDNTYKSNVPPLRGSIYSPTNYGGIHHGIYLVSSPLVRLNDVTISRVKSNEDGQIEVEISTEIRKFKNQDDFSNSLYDEYELSVSISTEGKGVIFSGNVGKFKIPPKGIYRNKFKIKIPDHTIGAQTGNNIRYNALLSLKGEDSNCQISTDFYLGFLSQDQEDVRCINYTISDPVNGPIIPANNLKTDVLLLLETGANTVKIAQGTQIPYFLGLCDQYGLKVYLELPVFQVPNGILTDENFIKSCLDQVTATISRYGRYSCIVGWGIGDGIEPPNNNNMPYYSRLTELIHRLDHRPVFASTIWMSNGDDSPLDFSIIDFDFMNVDLTNIYKASSSKFLIGGISSLVLPGNYAGWQDPTSEINQAYNIVETLKQIDQLNWPRGVIVGDFLDWRGNIPTIIGPLRGTTNIYSSGLMTGSRQPRPAYRAVSDYWKLGKNEPLPQGKYSTSDGSILVVLGLILIFILIVMARQNNIFRFNIQRTFASPSGFFQDIRDHRYFQTGHSLLLAIFISGAIGLTLTGWMQAHRSSFALDWIIGYLFRSNMAMEWIATLFWNPLRSVMFFWVISLFWLWTIILQFKLTGIVLRRKCTISQSIDLTVWSSVGIVGLLPIGLVSARLFSNNLGWLVIFVFAIVILWAQTRLLYVYATFFRLPPITAIWWWILPPSVIIMVTLIVLNKFHAIFIYWSFIFENIIR